MKIHAWPFREFNWAKWSPSLSSPPFISIFERKGAERRARLLGVTRGAAQRARDVDTDWQTHHRGRDVAACYDVAGRHYASLSRVRYRAATPPRDAASTLVVTTHEHTSSLGLGTRVWWAAAATVAVAVVYTPTPISSFSSVSPTADSADGRECEIACRRGVATQRNVTRRDAARRRVERPRYRTRNAERIYMRCLSLSLFMLYVPSAFLKRIDTPSLSRIFAVVDASGRVHVRRTRQDAASRHAAPRGSDSQRQWRRRSDRRRFQLGAAAQMVPRANLHGWFMS